MRFPKVSTTNINGLPLGYTEVEYLEGTGTQYIDTGYIPNNNSEIEIVCNSGGVQGTNLFGYRNASANSKNITITTSSTGTTVFYTNDFNNSNYNTYRYNFESNANQILKIKLSKSERSVYNTSGTLLGGNSVSCPDVFTCDSTAYLMNVAGTPFFTQCFKGKVYSCKISEAGVLIRNFIPCLDSNNRPCMYDKVEGKPYYNVGTDEFSYGKKIYGVEYLESSTTNARISTGILLDTFPFTARVSVSSKAEYNSFYQVIVGTTNSTNQYLICLKSGDPDFIMKYNNVAKTVGVVPVADKKYEISTTLTSTTMTMNIDGTDYTYTQALTASNEEIGLFPQNYNASPMRIYNAQLIKNNTLVRDYVPVRDENNIGYMLDKLSHILYENKGTGAFVVGGDTLGKSKAKLIKTKTTVSGLPYGYTEVEYIASSGNAEFLDTGVLPTYNTGVDIGFYITGRGSSGSQSDSIIIMSGGDSSGYRWGISYRNSGDTLQVSGICKTGVSWENYSMSANTYHSVKYNYTNNKDCYLDGTLVRSEIPGGDATINYPVYLFASNMGGTVWRTGAFRVYYCKITENGNLIRDYVPALDSNNRPCMYDIIEGKAYYNQGTGEFTYGPKIIPVEYLENTETGSSRNWINTGIVTDNNTKWEVKVSYNDTGTGKLMGSGIGGDTRFNLGIERSKFRFGFASGWFDANSHVSTSDTKPHIWILDSATSSGTIDGYTATSTSTFGTNTYPIGLFGRTNNTASVESSNTTAGKIYYSKIWKNNVLVQDLIPVCDENGIGYMYDKITHTLYANAGTGSFVVGNEKVLSKVRFIEDTSVISEYTKLKCLISSGTQYIDTGFKGKNNIDFDYKVNFTSVTTSSGYGIGGEWENGKSLYLGLIRSNGTFAYHYRNTASPVVVLNTIEANKDYSIQGHMWSGEQYMTINGTKSDIGTITGTFTSTQNITLFRVTSSSPIYCYAKIYECKIWDNNALIRDYIPVLRNSDNKPGMYDRVTKTFFTNQGTGEFTYETL